MFVQLKEVNQTRILGNNSVPIVGAYRQPFSFVFKRITNHPNICLYTYCISLEGQCKCFTFHPIDEASTGYGGLIGERRDRRGTDKLVCTLLCVD